MVAKAGVRWPAIPSRRASHLVALLWQMQESERWSTDRLLEAQQEQSAELLSHARKTVPFYAERLATHSSIEVGSLGWREIPLLAREDVQQHAARLRSNALPAPHGPVFETRTSGSTGQPVVVARTALLQLLWDAITLREHLWFERDASLSQAIIRVNGPHAPAPHGCTFRSWGLPFDLLWESGPSFALEMSADAHVQARWLADMKPAYLLTYPTNLERVLDYLEPGALSPREIRCIGEAVPAGLRERCAITLRAPLTSNYSSQELGYLALSCPDCGQLHVQSESVYVEILDEDGEPCRPGEFGRVVVTDLHNFAMPLIRYLIGDYAEVGEPCPAGRGLPSLRRVLGRRRNMVILPDGRRHWPVTGFGRFASVARIDQYQLIQHSRDEIEVRLVSPATLGRDEFRGLAAIITDSLGHPFRLRFRQLPGPLPRTRGGKFEEFVCLAQ
jgi:phenylacetate-CoA ligase